MYNLRKRKNPTNVANESNKKARITYIDNDGSDSEYINTHISSNCDDELSDCDLSLSNCDDELSDCDDDKNDIIANIVSKCMKKLVPDDGDDNIFDIKNNISDELDDIDISKEERDSLKSGYIALQAEIDSNKPCLAKILRANILKSDKKQALELYIAYKDSEDPAIKFKIESILSSENYISADKLNEYEDMEARILNIKSDYNSSIKAKIYTLDTDEKNKAVLYDMYMDLLTKNQGSDEYCSLRDKLIFLMKLPYNKIQMPEIVMKNKSINEINKYCTKIYNELDLKIYGLSHVKEKLVEIINNRIYNQKSKSLIVFNGPPGVGKSYVPHVLSQVIGLPFDKISLGGLEDPSVITGSNGV